MESFQSPLNGFLLPCDPKTDRYLNEEKGKSQFVSRFQFVHNCSSNYSLFNFNPNGVGVSAPWSMDVPLIEKLVAEHNGKGGVKILEQRKNTNIYGQLNPFVNPNVVNHNEKDAPTYTEKVRVPSSDHAAEIIGKEGLKIRQLRKTTNTYIQSPPREKEPYFEITGTYNDVQLAKLEILKKAAHFTLLRSHSKQSSLLPTEKYHVPKNLVGLVVGTKGKTIKRISRDSECSIITPACNAEPYFKITGSVHNIEKAKNLIHRHFVDKFLKMPVAPHIMNNDNQPRINSQCSMGNHLDCGFPGPSTSSTVSFAKQTDRLYSSSTCNLDCSNDLGKYVDREQFLGIQNSNQNPSSIQAPEETGVPDSWLGIVPFTKSTFSQPERQPEHCPKVGPDGSRTWSPEVGKSITNSTINLPQAWPSCPSYISYPLNACSLPMHAHRCDARSDGFEDHSKCSSRTSPEPVFAEHQWPPPYSNKELHDIMWRVHGRTSNISVHTDSHLNLRD